MAIINLDVEKILSISNELSSLDTTLLNSYVPEIKDIINQIKSNVLNEQVNSILGTISSQVDSISGELAVDLPKLEQFLDTQMQSYQTTEADAQAKLQGVVNTMGGFAGMQPVDINSGGSTVPGNGDGQSSNNPSVWQSANQEFLADQGALWSQYGENVSKAWKNVGESTGLIDGVINVADAAITTVVDTAGAAVSTVVDGAEWVLDQGVEVVENVVDFILPPYSW